MSTFYCKEKSFIYIHVPKTAGISISRILLNYSNDWKKKYKVYGAFIRRIDSYMGINILNSAKYRYYHPHSTIDDVIKKYNISKKEREHIVVLVISRNPLDRIVSEYRYLRQFKMMFIDPKAHFSARCGFDEYIDKRRFQTRSTVSYYDPRKNYGFKEVIVDVHELNSNWNEISKYIGIKRENLQRRNRSRGKEIDVSRYAKKRVNEIFKEDYEVFGYEFSN